MKWIVFILCALCAAVPANASVKKPTRTGTDLNMLASTMAGTPVQVDCVPPDQWQYADADGYVIPDFDENGFVTIEPIIYLPRAYCGPLKSLGLRTGTYYRAPVNKTWSWDVLSDGTVLDQVDGDALHALWHEATHIRLESVDEALVECTAYQTMAQAVAMFSLPPYLATRITRTIAYDHSQMPASYTADC